MELNWIGIMISANLTVTAANIGYTSWVMGMWIETETTQEGVLKTLDAHHHGITKMQNEYTDLHRLVSLIPSTIDSSDRWKKEQEMAYQASQIKTDHVQDERIRKLEEMHIYRHIGRYRQ